MKKKIRWGTLLFALVLALSFGLSGCDTGSDVSGPGANIPGGSLVLPSGYGWMGIPGSQQETVAVVFAENDTVGWYEFLSCCNVWDLEVFAFWSVNGNTMRMILPGFWQAFATFYHPSPNTLTLRIVEENHEPYTWRLMRKNLASLGRFDDFCRCW